MGKARLGRVSKDWLNESLEPRAATSLVPKIRKLPKKAHSPQFYAKLYSVDEDTITKAIRQGNLRADAIGGVWRISEDAWFDYLEQQARRKGVG